MFMSKMYVLVVFSLFPVFAHSEVRRMDPVLVNNGIHSWQLSFRKNLESFNSKEAQSGNAGYMECAEMVELPGAFICQGDKPKIDRSFGRASSYIESKGSSEKRTVVKKDDPTFRKQMKEIEAHDLLGSDLLEFHDQVNKICAETGDDQLCPSDDEKELFDQLIVPLSQDVKKFVVLAFSEKPGSKATATILGHELLHAQYFLQDSFREIVDQFWEEQITAKDKAYFSKKLEPDYDIHNSFLLKNEFQAYLLEPAAFSSCFYQILDKPRGKTYRRNLIEALIHGNVAPIRAQLSK